MTIPARHFSNYYPHEWDKVINGDFFQGYYFPSGLVAFSRQQESNLPPLLVNSTIGINHSFTSAIQSKAANRFQPSALNAPELHSLIHPTTP
ncbi:MAG: hypothetical protein Q8L79_01715 [Methylobacter sp.]|nr:hypothetical protein [Methylobacter sp.]